MSGVTYVPVGELVEAIGLAAALKLARRFGGRRVYVPQPERIKPEGPLAGTIGFDAVTRLAKTWRGQEIAVPKCVGYLARERARRIHAEPAAMSIAAIAAKYDITERWAFRILATPAPGEPAEEPARLAQRDFFLKA